MNVQELGSVGECSIVVEKGRLETEIGVGPNGPEIRSVNNGKYIDIAVWGTGDWFSVDEVRQIIGFLQQAIAVAETGEYSSDHR